MKNKTIALIGRGRIGSELKSLMDTVGISYQVIRRSPEAHNEIKSIPNLAGAFLCIPSSGDGQVAREYIETVTSLGAPIVTCEKGALANHWGDLQNRLGLIGYTATVGGGTRMLAQPRVRGESVIAIVNSTLNYLQTEGAGLSMEEAIRTAFKLKLCESDRGPAETVIRDELHDVVRKAVILWNHEMSEEKPISFADNILDGNKFSEALACLLNNKAQYRVVVRLGEEEKLNRDAVTFLSHKEGRRALYVGLMTNYTSKFLFGELPNGVVCKMVRRSGFSTVIIEGQGAGVAPTSTSMFQDAYRLGML